MKKFKSTLSLVLALIMIFSCCSVALGANTAITKPDATQYPQVVVTGFGSAKIYYEDDPEQTSLFHPWVLDRFVDNLANIPEYIVKSIKNKEPNLFYTCVYNYLMDCFGMLAYKPDGSMMDGVTIEPTTLFQDEDGRYIFKYDSRQSPVVLAPQLHDYIQQVMEHSGKDKVELVGISYGANVASAYIHLYRNDLSHIDSINLRVPSIGGVDYLGELMSGEFDVSAIGLCDLLHRFIGAGIIPDFFYLMEEAGILAPFIDAMLEPAMQYALYRAARDVARDAVATLPALWVCLPDKYFESALEYMYGENYRDPDHEFAKLISDMTYYHYEIANHAEELYRDIQDEVHLSIIVKYGVAAIPLTDGPNTMEDGFVPVPVASFGATCTTYGAQLPADYVQQKYTDYNFINPERSIDASTGIVPFTTWYLRGLEHSETSTGYQDIVDNIVHRNLTVFSDPEYPQYMTVLEDDHNVLVPVTEEEEEETLYQKFWKVFKAIVLFPKKVMDKIKEVLSLG
ncbi:MAG: alpha/beta hydrolase [Clostridia bacterium]|nr:alpha/beta hydrolase [Clostridia bacterium]